MSTGHFVGAVCAILSAVFNGSFAALTKIPKVAKFDLDPILFMLYFTLGFFLFSWLTVPFFGLVYNSTLNQKDANFTLAGGQVYVWSNWGLLAGLFQDLALTFSFFAISKVGLSIAQGVWGGTSIIISIVWGLALLGNTIKSTAGLTFAIIILLLSIAIIAFCNEIGTKFSHCKNSRGTLMDVEGAPSANPGNTQVVTSGVQEIETTLTSEETGNETLISLNKAELQNERSDNHATKRKRHAKDFVIGISSAVGVGFFGGSILVPLSFAAEPAGGIVFVPSQGIGAMIFAPIIAIIYFLSRKQKPHFHLRGTLAPGIFAGVVWGIGDVCSIFAIPFIGYAVAYPILQCALLISGLWGVFAFKEVTLCASKIIFFIAGIILIGGAFLLATSVEAN